MSFWNILKTKRQCKFSLSSKYLIQYLFQTDTIFLKTDTPQEHILCSPGEELKENECGKRSEHMNVERARIVA